MRVQLRFGFFFFILLLVEIVRTEDVEYDEAYQSSLKLLKQTLEGLTKAISYMAYNRKELNLDGVIGLRMADDQMSVIINRFGDRLSKNVLFKKIEHQLKYLQIFTELSADVALKNVKIEEPSYFKKLGAVIQNGIWEFYSPIKTLPQIPRNEKSKTKVQFPFNEKLSDICLAENFEKSKKAGENTKCNISDSCWKHMTSFGNSGYALTHEVFYLELGTMFNCTDQMNEKVLKYELGSVNALQDTFCANILNEAYDISEAGYPERNQDLLLEQIALCGILGYREFLNPDWVNELLKWQDESGCFTRKEFEESRRKKRHTITKREDKDLDGGCSSHKTSVAIGAMINCIRFLIEGLLDGISFS